MFKQLAQNFSIQRDRAMSQVIRALWFLPTIPLPGRGITPIERCQTNPGNAIKRVTQMDILKNCKNL